MKNQGWLRGVPGALVLLVAATPASANMVISLTAGSTLGSNSAAMGAFSRAISYWDSVFADPITVNITADFAALGANIIGQASSAVVGMGYTTVRNQMALDGTGEPAQAVTNALPTAGQFIPTLPSGFSYNNQIVATTANLKALGLLPADPDPDGTLTFSTGFAFDFDNRDGLTAGTIDFETVVLHEIGHVLGFISGMDEIDRLVGNNTPGPVSIAPLDLFRFPSKPLNFTAAARELRPGVPAVFSDGTVQYGLSNAVDHQASHWLDDNGNATLYIGIMDPTLSPATIGLVTAADLYAFDLIGYDLASAAVPEPGTFAFVAGAALLLVARRRRG